MTLKRYLHDLIVEDLAQKMVFLAGPRQVGKTTLAKDIMNESPAGLYYLWDNRNDRRELLKAQWPAEPTTVVLDELHKYRKWKQWIKGEFDKYRDHLHFIVTGSARLDIYRKGGDSLQGRYRHYRLHPFSLNELHHRSNKIVPMKELVFPGPAHDDALDALFKYSGFPEPFVGQSTRTHRRWQKDRMDRFFREDVRDLENLRDLSSIQLLADLLPERVGSPLSLNSLREDLEVSHKALTHWMDVLENLYYVFRIRPFTTTKIRGLKKEPKAYLWDWTLANDEGARFENMIASHLLKLCHFLEDSEGYRIELHYLRDIQKHEVDFMVAVDRKPWFAVEVKTSSDRVAPALNYFGSRLKIPFLYQVVLKGERDFMEDGVRVIPAAKFLSGLV